jgi:hypothetical protein
MKYLFKYSQAAYPYSDLVETNRRRSRQELEYELMDTGVFDDGRYFDVYVEYAKNTPEDLLIRFTVHNRGAAPARLHLLPSLWFRNTWSWSRVPASKPRLTRLDDRTLAAFHPELGERYLYCDRPVPLLFTENETNTERVFKVPNTSPYVKDGFNNYIVEGRREGVNPGEVGTKAAAHYEVEIPAAGHHVVELRLTDRRLPSPGDAFGPSFGEMMATRLREADEFYAQVIPATLSEDSRLVARQAFAGMLWSKQFYYYPVRQWMEDEVLPADCAQRVTSRNREWFFLESADIFSMPDKWEYPWFAAWDLAFHCMVLARVDVDFAKEQLRLITNQVYLHPSGQIPAYEWNFSDVNPPVHCKATWQIYLIEKLFYGKGDLAFLESMFQKLLMNFTWWVNRKDELGNNVFEGGFLGLDNIGLFDRSAPLPTGGTLEQADGTSWMAMFCLDMLTVAVELALHNPVYEDLVCKFFEHFIYIAGAMDRIGIHNDELWDEEEGFYYDVLRLPRGDATRVRVRSMVGLIPLFASAAFSSDILERLPRFKQRVEHFVGMNAALVRQISNPLDPGVAGRILLSPVNRQKLVRVLQRMLDPAEFLSPHGIRALSRYHKEHPYVFAVNGSIYRVDYEPAESSTGLFGGNSNWRGPIWMPVNVLIIQSLRKMYSYYGDELKVECPVGSGCLMTVWEVAHEIATRLSGIFLRDAEGRRPVHGATERFQTDPHWRDLILFYEYFHGDNGAGIGASHQTGWTGLVTWLLLSAALLDPQQVLEKGFDAAAMTRLAVVDRDA